MRHDMAKVIVERPRRGGWKRGKALRDDFDGPMQQGIRRPHVDRKGLNENLAPLIRFLRSRVGKHWSKVYSEISEHLRAENAVQQHVRDHLNDFVAVQTALRNSKIVVHREGWRSGPEPLTESFCRFYVHPVSGVLHANKYRDEQMRRRAATRQQKDESVRARRIDLGPMRQLHKLKGCWFAVELEKTAPATAVRGGTIAPARDAVRDAGLSALSPQELYGLKNVHAKAKRQLGRKELAAHGLQNDTDV